MKLESNVFLHIGANKTGSTTLQRWLFAKTKELSYLGEDCEDYEDYRDVLNSLVSDDDIYFANEKASGIFERYTRTHGNKTFLYSNEDIMTSRVPTLCANRLRKLMPGAEIIVVIRNQLTAISSMYANHGAYLKMVPRSFWRRYVSFDDWMNYSITFHKYSYLDSYYYHRILSLYANLFGKDKIHVLFFEDFMRDPEMFIRKLCSILKINPDEAYELLKDKRERKRRTIWQLKYHQFRSQFFWGRSLSRYFPFGTVLSRMWQELLAKGPPANNFISDYWRKKIIELYQEDNSKLAKEYGLPLKDYGYPVL